MNPFERPLAVTESIPVILPEVDDVELVEPSERRIRHEPIAASSALSIRERAFGADVVIPAPPRTASDELRSLGWQIVAVLRIPQIVGFLAGMGRA